MENQCLVAAPQGLSCTACLYLHTLHEDLELDFLSIEEYFRRAVLFVPSPVFQNIDKKQKDKQ